MRYVITANQGRTVFVEYGQSAASDRIMSLIKLGVSYSVETF